MKTGRNGKLQREAPGGGPKGARDKIISITRRQAEGFQQREAAFHEALRARNDYLMGVLAGAGCGDRVGVIAYDFGKGTYTLTVRELPAEPKAAK